MKGFVPSFGAEYPVFLTSVLKLSPSGNGNNNITCDFEPQPPTSPGFDPTVNERPPHTKTEFLVLLSCGLFLFISFAVVMLWCIRQYRSVTNDTYLSGVMLEQVPHVVNDTVSDNN